MLLAFANIWPSSWLGHFFDIQDIVYLWLLLSFRWAKTCWTSLETATSLAITTLDPDMHEMMDGPKKKNYNQGTPKKLLYIMLWLFWCLLGMGILLKTGHIQTHHFIIRLFRTCILQNIYHTNKSIKIIVQIAFSTLKKTNTAINTFQLSAKPPAYSISQPPPFPATPFPSRGLSLEPLRLQDLTGFRSCIWITTQSLQQHLVKAWHGWRMAMATPTMKAPMGLRDNWWFS